MQAISAAGGQFGGSEVAIPIFINLAVSMCALRLPQHRNSRFVVFVISDALKMVDRSRESPPEYVRLIQGNQRNQLLRDLLHRSPVTTAHSIILFIVAFLIGEPLYQVTFHYMPAHEARYGMAVLFRPGAACGVRHMLQHGSDGVS